MRVARRQRASLLIMQLVPSLLFALLLVVATQREVATDRSGVQLAMLLHYLGRGSSVYLNASTVAPGSASYTEPCTDSFNGARSACCALPDSVTVRKDGTACQRRLVAVYIATTLAARARDTTRSSFVRRWGLLSDSSRVQALEIASAFSSADTTEVRNAQYLADSV